METLYVLVGADGEYEDYRERWLRAYTQNDAAQAELVRVRELHAMRFKAWREIEPFEDGIADSEHERRWKRQQRHAAKTAELIDDYGAAEDTTYRICPLRLVR